MKLKIISAGAGSGKTYRLTSEMVALLKQGIRANGIIATTFTQKAAAELQERVRVRLLEDGLSEQAEALTNAMIGTVHSLGVKLLKRFAYEAGVSPEVSIIAEEDQQILFNQSLANVLTEERVNTMERLCDRLGLHSNIKKFDWRSEVRKLTEVARANDFSEATLQASSERSFEAFRELLGPPSKKSPEAFNKELEALLLQTINQLQDNGDQTKTTQDVLKELRQLHRELHLRKELHWRQWVKISKIKPGAKSRDTVAELAEFARTHEQNPLFQQDIRDFIAEVFGLTIAAIREYAAYKNQRGLIDYTDMETLVKHLLQHDAVRAVLSEELDLLLVDEFQDTSPLQLDIFLKLSQLTRYSIWVGDPKQSIYGFRGAAPELMQAIIEQSGGIQPEDIQSNSWRSREDLVYAANAIFTKAFDRMPPEQVALNPRRTAGKEPIEASDALIHWHFQPLVDEENHGNRQPGKPWMENCIAFTLREWLDKGLYILPKGESSWRRAQAGDVAILCRSNDECQEMAEALHRAGLGVSIARGGLLQTAEASLILAGLKYLLHYQDTLSVAEILLLAAGKPIENIIEERLDYLGRYERKETRARWEEDHPLIRKLDRLRPQVAELSSAETLDLLLDELDLRRVIAGWGNVGQRLDNVDVIRRLAQQYEDACNRLHTAASLGGFLLWLSELESNKKDMQGSGESAEAVNVMTYHKSKGLEWPVVVCHSLETTLKLSVWGIDIIPETDRIDLDNLLGNRWLRYWVNPYANQSQNTPLLERIEQSQVYSRKQRQSLEEENRLLYVGLTRARDYLIFPTGLTPSRWLNRAWHEGQEELPTLDPQQAESPWEWNGTYLPVQNAIHSYPRNFTPLEPLKTPVYFLEAPAGKQPHTPLYIDLNKEKLPDPLSATTSAVLQYASDLSSAGASWDDPYSIAKAAKAFLTAYHDDYPKDDILEMATGLVNRFGVADQLKPGQLFQAAQSWSEFLRQYFPASKAFRKFPVRHLRSDGRIFDNVLDLLLETDTGWVIIQNSGFTGDPKNWRNKALELAPWFFLAAEAIQAIFGKGPVRTYVHLVLHGVVVQVETKSHLSTD